MYISFQRLFCIHCVPCVLASVDIPLNGSPLHYLVSHRYFSLRRRLCCFVGANVFLSARILGEGTILLYQPI